jgi:hypothetical protein
MSQIKDILEPRDFRALGYSIRDNPSCFIQDEHKSSGQ